MSLPALRDFEIATECLHDAGFADSEIEEASPLLYGPDNEPLGIEISHNSQAHNPRIFDETREAFSPELERLLGFHDAILIHGVRAEIYSNVIETLSSLRSLIYHGDAVEGCRVFWSPLGASRESHLLAEVDTTWTTLKALPEVQQDPVFQEIMAKEDVAPWIRMVRYASRRQGSPEHSANVIERINAVLGAQQFKEIRYQSKANQILILRLCPGKLVHGKIPNPIEDPDGPFYAQDFPA